MGIFTPSFSCGAKWDDYIYASASKFNGLVKVNINDGGTEYLLKFPGDEGKGEIQHSKAYVYNGEIFFFPAFGNYIHIYNPSNNNIAMVEVDRQWYKYEYYALLCDEVVVMIPKNVGGDILKFDLSSREISVLVDWNSLNDYMPKEAVHSFLRVAVMGSIVYLPVYDSSLILILELNSLAIEVKNVPVHRLLGVFGGNEGLFLLTNNSSHVFKWNPIENKVINCKLDDVFQQNNRFTFAMQINKSTVFFPNYSSSYIGIGQDCEVYALLGLENSESKLMFLEPFCAENVIWALPYESDYLLYISEKEVIKKKLGKIEVDLLNKELLLESRIKTEKILSEDDDIQLADYIRWVVK